MKHSIKRLSGLLLLSMVTNVVYADDTVTFIQIKGNQVLATITTMSIPKVSSYLPEADEARDGETVIILEEGKKPRWTKDSIEDIAKSHGDSDPVTNNIPSPPMSITTNSKRPTEIDLEKIPSKDPEKKIDPNTPTPKKPIEIFDDIDAMQPEDGTWQLSVISNTYDASCPKDPFPPASIAGMTRPVQINWSTPWKPTAFFQHYPKPESFNYKQLSPSQWSVSGVPFKLPKSSAAAAPSMKILIEEDFTLVNPRELKVNATLSMKMSVRGMMLVDCKGHLKMLAKHIKGPKIKIN